MPENTDRLPDEDTFVIPDDWRARIHPRRGGVSGPPAELDEDAVTAIRARTLAHTNLLEEALANPRSDQRLVEAGRAHLNGQATPLGAGVVAAVVCSQTTKLADRALFADAWVAEHGVVFAARATVQLGGVIFDSGHLRYWAADSHGSIWVGLPVARRLRAVLATAAEQDYRDTVDALAHLRTNVMTRLVASYLLPTQLDWADEVCSDALAAQRAIDHSMLLGAIGTVEQLARISANYYLRSCLHLPQHLLTVLDVVGPAIAPTVARLLDEQAGEVDDRKFLLEVLATLPTDEAFELLLARLEESRVAPAVALATSRYPVRALRLLARAATDRSSGAAIAAELFRGHVRTNPEIAAAARPVLPAEVGKKVDEVLDPTGRVKEAPTDALPRLLVEPPWTRKRKAGKPVVIGGLVPEPVHDIVWAPGEQQEWASPRNYWPPWGANTDWAGEIASYREGRLNAYRAGYLFADAPEHLVRPLLPDWRPGSGEKEVTKRIVARHGLDAFPFALHVGRANPAGCGEALVPFVSAEVAELMADWLVRLKSARSVAVRWFGRHREAAVRLLVPAALGEPGKARSNAEAALRLVATKGASAEVVAIARGYGEQAADAVEALLAADPLEALLPARMPKIGNWVDVRVLPRVLLRTREHVLPFTATEHIVTMLALSKPDEMYPGLEVVKELSDPGSLAEFGWSLFLRWQIAGMPSKDGWALIALAWIGNDDIVRRLTPVIRAWPGQGGHSRAATGLDVLAAIGTDVALTHLNRIAKRVKFRGIKIRAQEKISELARDLGLTADQLADRLVPDFGLDASGSMALDYGRRRFTVGFDEHLKPFVLDENGKRLRSLPKPGPLDDHDLAAIARERFAALKKDVPTTATEQIRRLYQAMVTQRRWTAAEFRQLLVDHPLLWHIVRRLLWTSDLGAFRIAEDRTFADVNDDTITLPDDAQVAVAHPAALGDALGTWAETFADYEILQPFAQLGHPVHRLTDEERAATELKRFHDITVPDRKVTGLRGRGWQRGERLHNGTKRWMFKPIPGNRAIVIGLQPDTRNQGAKAYPDQTVTSVWLSDRPGGDWVPSGGLTFAELDSVAASELLADLTDLTS